MEKVCVAWWRRPEQEPVDLRRAVLPILSAPQARAATLHVEAPEQAALRHGAAAHGSLLTALASIWLDSYQDLPVLPLDPKRVFGEVTAFIDMDTIQVAPMSEYVVRRLSPTSP